MSKIEELIQEYCPDGVEYVEIGKICETVTPSVKVKSSDYLSEGLYPVIDQGKDLIGGYTNEIGCFPNGEYVIFGDHTCAVKYVNFPFVQGADGVKVLKAHDDIIPRYLYHCMTAIFLDSEYKRHWSIMRQREIPLPALPVQREIVRILDSFTALQDELQKELEERKKQYTWLEEELITGPRYTVKKLSECATVERGKRLVRKQLSSDKNGGYPVYQNALEPLGYYSESNRRSNIPFVIAAGAAGKLGYSYTEFWAADDCYTIVNNRNVYGRYLYYAIEIQSKYLKDHVRMGSIPRIAKSFVEETQIFLPDYQQQVIIANKLDTLFQLIDKTIPSEIALRQQQYSYYRDKLLSFPRKEA